MAVVVKLEDILAAMDLPQEWEAFLDPETGEIVTLSDEDRSLLDDEDDELDELSDWQEESHTTIRRVLDSGRALRLPDAFDIHEWDLMRRFSQSVEDAEIRVELLNAIHGSGAFRFFKAVVARVGLRDEWFKYRDDAVRNLARDWLEAHEIPFVEEGDR